MKPNEILSAQLLDIVFEGRNKEYGAYDLRKNYKKRMEVSLATMAFVCLLLSVLKLFAGNGNEEVKPIYVKDLSISSVHVVEKPKIIPVIPPVKKVDLPKIKTIQYTAPLITDDHKVDDAPPPVDDLVDARISTITQAGGDDDKSALTPVEISTTTASIKKPDEDIDTRFTKIEKEARFPGGPAAWKRYLERSLNGNIASDDGASVGFYSVKVQFVVDQQGNISNVEAVEVPKLCPTCGKEAIRVIKKGPKWEPAIQNGRPVVYQAVQYITFEVASE